MDIVTARGCSEARGAAEGLQPPSSDNIHDILWDRVPKCFYKTVTAYLYCKDLEIKHTQTSKI